jgi:hypothetical protein
MYRFVGTQTDNKKKGRCVFYGGYLAVKNNAGLGYTLRLGIDAETMYRFVGTQTDNKRIEYLYLKTKTNNARYR